MKKVFTLLVLALVSIGTAWAEGTVEKATNVDSKDKDLVGTCYTIAGKYIAGKGGAKVGDMQNAGIKLRTGADGARVVFNVKTGYVITDFKLYGVSNYALKDGASEPCIAVTKVEVDGEETTQTGTGSFPAKSSSTSGSVLLAGINATTTITIYFDNSNASGTQINAYYELTWEEAVSSTPLQTVVTPESATIAVGETKTLKGEFSGGDFTGQWVSSDESVATVSADGKVTGVAPGTANITFQWADDQSQDAYKATAAITVIGAPQGTTVSPAAAAVAIGQTVTLKGSFTVGQFEGQWVSSDENIATVSAEGVVTGVAEGTADITFQWKNDQSEEAYKATAAVTVVDATFDKELCTAVKTYDFANWGATTLTIDDKDKAGSIWNQANSKNNDVFWCTNENLTDLAIQAVLKDSKGFTINGDGLYEGSGAGRCAAIGNIKKGQFVEFNHNSETSFFTKSDKSDDGILKLACVEEKGHHVYYALEDGMIGFELAKGHYVTSIVIYEPMDLSGEPTELTFGQEEVSVAFGESFTAPTLTASPSDLTGIEYSSSNEKVATVDAATGEVTIVGLGTTTITAKFAGDDTYNPSTASYTLNVNMAAVDSKTWDFSTWDDEADVDIAETTIIDDLQIAASESAKVSINSNVLKFGGTGAANQRHIRFRIAEGTHLITIVARHGGSGDPRPLRMSFGSFGAKGFNEWSMTAGTNPSTLYYTYSGDETDVYIYSGKSGINLSSVSVSSADEVPVSVATDMATYVTPFDMDFSAVEGLKAYVVSEVTATAAVLEEVGAVPANTPVLLEGKGLFSVPVASSASAPAANELKAGQATMADGDYVLKGGKFVRATAESVLPAGKAYITVPAGARELEFVFGGATAISEVKSAEADGAVYNLSGVRVVKAQKGIYIQNGKKIVK